MKAGRIVAPRTLDIVEAPEPVCGPGEVKVKLEYGCLCGTDSPYFAYDFQELKHLGGDVLKRQVDYRREDMYPMPVGLPLHECVGVVVESRSDRVGQGAFVLALPPKQDGLAEYLVLPEAFVFPLPEGEASKEELLLCQPLGTIHYGFRKLPDLAGKSVAVVGQGPIGQLMNADLFRRGAGPIFGIDRLASRLEKSGRMKASHAIDATACDPVERLKELNDGRFADVVIEAVGHREVAMDLCVELAAQDGHVLLFGAIDTDFVESYPLGNAMRKNLSAYHSIGANKAEHFLPAAEMIAKGEIDVSPVLTHRFPMAETQKAFECFVDRQDGSLKVLLEF